MASGKRKRRGLQHETVRQRYPESKRTIGTTTSAPKINTSMDDVMKVWSQDVPGNQGYTHGSNKEVLGSSLPFLFSLMGDLIINPSTVSPSTYKKMVDTDPVIQISLKYIIDFTLNKIKEYTHPDPEWQKHIRRCIAKNRRGFKTMCRDMLTSIVYGHSESEMEWGWDEELGCDVVVETYPLPQMTVVMRVNFEGNIKENGIGQYVFNGFTSGFNSPGGIGGGFGLGGVNPFMPISGSYGDSSSYGCEGYYGNDPLATMGDLDYPYRSNVTSPVGLTWIPRRKIIQMVNYGVTAQGNPYGYGLRHVYDIWVKGLALDQFMLKAIRTKSAPLLVFFGDPNTPVGDTDPNGVGLYGGGGEYNGMQQGRTIPDAIKEEVAYMDSTSAMVLPGLPGQLADVKSVENTADVNIMMEAKKYNDEMKMSALFVPRTIFGGGGEGRGSHSLSKTHTDVTTSYCETLRNDTITVMINQYIRPQIEEYYTDEEIAENDHYYGSFETDTISIDEQLKLMQMVKIATDTGFVSSAEQTDLNFVRKMIDFEKMDKAIKVFENQLEKESMTTRDVKDTTGTPYAHAGG